ncbi:hypothetical protein BU23DRAFT_161711 [Bimuria novae-zelandiae CBS 107.79]|uniref:Siderophore biosynthesis enzyme n=1 Tax=Bimuria novae-zelandiae CBS 107.79 TaxID=1447943 RepID=A0A6A5V5I6_9PLEO|nr:hypothetical protein BU23DRAFT_161711 [Bimuria novae-zelandiae CBS 107.79]
MKTTLFSIAALAATVLAKTDLEGCTSSETVVYGGASLVYWDPTNGEICSFLDCGGGRAPPKKTVPGCAAYEGTATYSPDFLPGWGSATATASSEAEQTETIVAGESGESVPAYETKTESAASTLVTSKAVLPSVSGTGVAGVSGYVTGVTTKGSNVTASTGSPSATESVPVEATGAASHFGAAQGLGAVIAAVFGFAIL